MPRAMGFLDAINHAINFLAPALVVGAALALIGPIFYRKKPAAPGYIAQTAINFIAGAVAMGVGLIVFGRDAKMASYAAMLAMSALSQAWALRQK
jgi:hypothetical protein